MGWTQNARRVSGQIYEQLARDGKEHDVRAVTGGVVGGPGPAALARFHLRKGVKFQYGTPLTAADVVLPVKRSQHPNAFTPRAYDAAGNASQDRRLHCRARCAEPGVPGEPAVGRHHERLVREARRGAAAVLR